jgi:hypothetical protein
VLSVVRFRRVLVSIGAVAGSAALVTAMTTQSAGAQTNPTATTTAVTLLPTTTTTTTTAPRSTTTSTTRPAAKSTTTTTRKGSPPTGVPSVPVGGPPTTAPKKGATAPPPNPGPVLTAVQQDVDQLAAISDYKPAQAAVTSSQQEVTLAGATLLAAQTTLNSDQHAVQVAQKQVYQANGELQNLAIAAYVGVGYPTAGAQPPSLGAEGPGTVATPGGLTGIQAQDADEMLVVVAQRVRKDTTDARQELSEAKKVVTQDQKVCQKDRDAVSAAESDLLTSQETLKLVMAAATSPAAAAATSLPNFGAKPGGTKKATVAKTGSTVVASLDAATTSPAPPSSPSILGASIMTGPELAAWYKSTARKPNITVNMNQLAADYQAWGKKTGVRYDVAFAQSIVETGFFSFPTFGQLTPKDNNFAGIGACDTCAHGWSFANASDGVGAQLELLYEFASTKPLPKGLPNEIGVAGIGGCCTSWMALAGRWASSVVYGISIMTIYNQMLSWVIPHRLQAAGLISVQSTAARGPELAPLPGGKPPSKPADTGTSTRISAAALRG